MDLRSLAVSYLFPALVIFTGVVGYVFAIRPILKQNPNFAGLYATEDTMLNAIAAKLSGVKQKLMTILISLAGVIVLMHDQLMPLIAQTGVNVDPAKILPSVPAWVWPIATIAVLWLLQYFCSLADQQARANAEALLSAGQPLAAPAPGLPVNTLPSPAPTFADKKD